MLPRALLVFVCLLAAGLASPARAQTSPAQTAWRLLDYIAVDYREAVENGNVVNQAEFSEMVEFSARVGQLIGALPQSPGKASLIRQAADLERLIAGRAAAPAIAAAARRLAADLIRSYPVPLAPRVAPDLARGRALYAEHCATCHGATGHADGPQAQGLEPPPIAFTDQARASERSVFALYQVIEQGLEGTSMASFADLPAQDRWALAFYVGTLAYPEALLAEGRALWEADPALRQRLDLEQLVGMTPASLASETGEERAEALMAYLRRYPEAATTAPAKEPLALARRRLAEAMAAYERAQARQASDLALSAYLDGFEPVEPVLAARDHGLMLRIEEAMAHLRAAIAREEPIDAVRARIAALDALFGEAEAVLAAREASATSAFIAAFTILLREGLEALLIVIAMIAFLTKADRRDVLPHVHAGWVAALLAGAGTWVAATWLITISGASRELSEGVGGVLAALVLLWVGIWMHGKSHADNWQRYIRDRLGRALNRRSAWFLFALVFLVVYREVFETILFYAAIWSQGHQSAVLTGAASAVVVLAIIALAMIRFSRKLPIGRFLSGSAVLMAVLAVVLIGKGSAALQEAGILPLTPWPAAPRSELLGLYPTRQTILAQVLMILLLALGFLWNRRAARRSRMA